MDITLSVSIIIPALIYVIERFFCNKKSGIIMSGINKIIGVYHADGGILGELKYMTGKFFGKTHCALCDITHGRTGKKDAWKQCEEKLGIPINFVHLNERNEKLLNYTNGNTPCIVGKTSTNYVMLASKKELEECEGNATALSELLEKKI
jgi:hypothetical protein|tara:strand:- start:266 stop:715 length:450 start_codon:yes stop_codon:yes gene_type:complete